MRVFFCVVFLLQHLTLLINSASQITSSLFDFLANVCKLAFDQAMGEVNFASPRVRLAVHPLILISTLWLNDVQEYF